jgi:predicted nucleic acid-binding protein
MESIFQQYFFGKDDDIKKLLKEGTIILDTNALLNLYRFEEENQKKFLEILSKFKGRLWLPYTVGDEFLRNRENVIYDKMNLKNEIESVLEKEIDKLKEITRNPSNIDSKISHLRYENTVKDKLNLAIENFREEMSQIIADSDFFCLGSTKIDEDSVLEELSYIYDKCIGTELDKDSLSSIYKEGKKRYENDIPPGYKDKKKKEPEKYGDLVVWKEIIKYAKDNAVDVLFISDDQKEDWYRNNKGIKSLRRELVKEFADETGKNFYAISSNRFVELSSAEFGIDESNELSESIDNINTNTFTIGKFPAGKHLEVELNDEAMSQLDEYIRLMKLKYKS